MRSSLVVWLGMFVVTAGASMPVAGQIATATLAGVVVDSSGGTVSDVDLLVVNTDTGLQRTARSGGDGSFAVTDLPPGPYRLDARRDGFAPASLTTILHIGDRVNIRVPLAVGRLEDQVSVIANASVARTDAAVATVVNHQFVENQPLNGRNFQALVELAPGVVLTSTNVTTSGQFSVNGQRPNTNYFTVDGVSANFGVNGTPTLYESSGGMLPAYSALGGINNLVSVDALQEFTLETSTYAPEFGRQPGAQVAVVTRSGSNRFTGTAFEYLRNDRFESNDYFAEKNGIPKQKLSQHDFGGVFGGPIVKDRTFFFASYEGLRLTQPATSSPIPVPTLAARQQATGYAQAVLSAFPLPNGPVTSFDPGLATFIGGYTVPSSLDATSVRIDHSLNSTFNVFGRFSYAPSEIDAPAVFTLPNTTTITPSLTRTLTIGGTNIWGASAVNDLRVNYSRSELGSQFALGDYGGASIPPLSSLVPPFADATAMGAITIRGGSVTTIDTGLNAANAQRQLNVVDAFSWILGSHALKAGFDYRRLMPILYGSSYRQLLTYSSVAQVLAATPATARLISANVNPLYPVYNNYSAFFQDSWRLKQRATLTYGLRYEVDPAPHEQHGHDPLTVTGLDNLRQLALAPQGTRLYATTFHNVAPRMGLAYDLLPGRGTLLRAGFGTFYDLGYAFTGSAYGQFNYPFAQTRSFANTPISTIVSSPPPPFTIAPPYQRATAYTPGFELPYTLEYNAAVEQPIGSADRITIAFVGANGRRLGRVVSLNNSVAPIGPTFTRVDVVSNEAHSRYTALQAQYQRRFSRGLQTLASYTLAESMDNVSDESIVNFQAPSTRLDPQLDWGPSAFDVRHAVSAAVSYDVPDASAGVAHVFRDFGVDAILRARSALPVNVVTGRDTFGIGLTNISRPDVVPGVTLYVDDPTVAGGRRINPAAFTAPPPGVQGNLERNGLRGFAAWQLDLSVRRRLIVAHGFRIEFRADAFNVTNHANLANPPGALTDPNFGVSTQMLGTALGTGGISGGLSPLYQIGGPRSIQFALRCLFH